MKKVLIITYYWPPAGGPGVQRWLKFVKYLPEFGIEPIVYVPENPSYPIVDTQLINEVPKDITVIKTKISEPYFLAKLFTGKQTAKMSSGIIPKKDKQGLIQKFALWVRGNFFIPDARVFWVKPSLRFLKNYIRENSIDTIITSGPPHSLHLIGLGLKEQVDVTWFADFRDPWTTIGYHKELKLFPATARKHKYLEKKVLASADHIIVTSKTTKAEFETLTNQPVSVITNGHDLENSTRIEPDRKFSLAHIGSLLSGRNPLILWDALAELAGELEGFSENLELKLIGTVSPEIVHSIAEAGLEKHTAIKGYLQHSEAVSEQRRSQVLLLIEIDSAETKSIIPGKLFEYMVSGRPIIAIGPQGSDISEIISETESGEFFGYQDKTRLKNTISAYYQKYLVGQLYPESRNTEKYSRRNLTAELASVLLKK